MYPRPKGACSTPLNTHFIFERVFIFFPKKGTELPSKKMFLLDIAQNILYFQDIANSILKEVIELPSDISIVSKFHVI